MDRLSRQGEEALGSIAEELIANPVVNRALTGAFEAREKAVQAQEAAMGALNIPSAADIERLTRRLRSVSQRLEGIEDSLDRLEERAGAAVEAAAARGLRTRLARRELDEIARDLAALREAVAPGGEPVPRAQERLTVTEAQALTAERGVGPPRPAARPAASSASASIRRRVVRRRAGRSRASSTAAARAAARGHGQQRRGLHLHHLGARARSQSAATSSRGS